MKNPVRTSEYLSIFNNILSDWCNSVKLENLLDLPAMGIESWTLRTNLLWSDVLVSSVAYFMMIPC